MVAFALYKNNKMLGVAKHYEDIEDFVEELKRLNPKWVDRREFVIKCNEEVFRTWNRK